jgi:hypothetical protein
MLRPSVIFLLLFTGIQFLSSCKEEGCNGDKYYVLTPEQKLKFPYRFDENVSLIFTDSTGRDSIPYYRQPLENIVYTNEYISPYSSCIEKHHAEMMRRSFETFDKRHLFQVSLFTEEYIGNVKKYAEVATNSFLFRLDTMSIHINESMLAASTSHLVDRYSVLVGKDTVQVNFKGALLKSIYVPSKGLTIEIK